MSPTLVTEAMHGCEGCHCILDASDKAATSCGTHVEVRKKLSPTIDRGSKLAVR